MGVWPRGGPAGSKKTNAPESPRGRWINVGTSHHWPPCMTDSRHPFARLAATNGWAGYGYASAIIVLGFALAFLADRYLSIANPALIFLTAVLAVAVRTRMSVAVYTAVMCFLGYNFFFTRPRYTLAIANADDVLAVVLFLVVALVSGHMATRLARQVASLRAAQARARILLELGQCLAANAQTRAICDAGVAALVKAIDAEVAVLAPTAEGGWQVRAAAPVTFEPGPDEIAAADGLDPGQPVTATDVLSNPWVMPLGSATWRAGAIVIRPRGPSVAEPDRSSLAREMVRDIGMALERGHLAEALEEARVQAETERLRNALLSSVSHDLRSPLASMVGAASTLASYESQLPAAERRELLDAILGEGQRLDRYIQNLLDMARLGHGTLTLRRDWVDANEVVLAAVARVRRYYPALGIETRLPRETLLLYVHPALIEQALFNILENAAHVSPPGRPVEVELLLAEGSIRIEVSDEGPGIPEEERNRIFDMFFSVSRRDRAPKGIGLGLSICRGMIGAHGGSVEALTRMGGGTILRVTLPLPVPPETNA
ncbi:histidine kinase [Bacillus sp. SRB_336]|nr:histidine kinase [Bacillus sp. SRB_336]